MHVSLHQIELFLAYYGQDTVSDMIIFYTDTCLLELHLELDLERDSKSKPKSNRNKNRR